MQSIPKMAREYDQMYSYAKVGLVRALRHPIGYQISKMSTRLAARRLPSSPASTSPFLASHSCWSLSSFVYARQLDASICYGSQTSVLAVPSFCNQATATPLIPRLIHTACKTVSRPRWLESSKQGKENIVCSMCIIIILIPVMFIQW